MLRTALLLLVVLFTNATVRAMEWNGLFVAGDDAIEAFDNSQQGLIEVLERRGLQEATRYTASRRVAKAHPDIALLNEKHFDELERLRIAGTDKGCLVHLTSHGGEGQGFYLAMSGGIILDPDYVARLLDQLCGASPRTVVLISACYSGQFITDAIKRPNRIIMTAARADRPSFGCSATDTYTYWDGCLIEELPRSKTWARLYDNVRTCIEAKEAAIGAVPSEPQAWFGENTRGWRVLN